MSPSNHPDWTHVRMRRATKARLEQFILGKSAYYEKTGRGLPTPNGTPSIDEIVTWFLDQEDGHKERGRKARRKRKAERRAAKGLPPGPVAPDGIAFQVPLDIAQRGHGNGEKA